MSKLKNVIWSLYLFLFFVISCTNEKPFIIDPPIPGLETTFTEIKIDPLIDSTYVLDNDTRITVRKGSLLDNEGNQIIESVTFKFRQFDDAVSIFLSGLPMSYSRTKDNMILETAGMYEIRGEYMGQTINIDPEKPLSITIGSFYENQRQGFFKLDEETGDWDLVDIPEAKYNEEVLELRKKVANLKPEWEIPLPPNYYVFSLWRMADIFLNDDYYKIGDANLEALSKKMEDYGVKTLNVGRNWNSVKYKGNSYEADQMLWKSENSLTIPKWVKDTYGSYYDPDKQEYKEKILLKKINGNIYKLSVNDYENNRQWTTNLQLITHLRYLVRYSPEQLIAKQKEIEQEINEAEERLKNMRIIEYTADIYQMGIYNCDKPVYFQNGKPQLKLSLDGKAVSEEEIHKVSIFNENLSSYAFPVSYKPLTFSFFKGTNKILLITKNGDIGLFSGQNFEQLDSTAINKSLPLEINLTKVNVENEEKLRKLLIN